MRNSMVRLACIYIIALVLAACAIKQENGFALYMVLEITDPRQVDEYELTDIQLDESPIINENDILSYDLETHQMELTEEAYARVSNLFSLPVDVDGMPFVVVVDNEPIYSGAFYTPASSISYGGVVVIQPFSGNSRTISLELGYPGPGAFEGEDPRSDFRIIDRLREANKLK